MTNSIERVNVLGVDISAINMDTALQQIEYWIETEGQQYVCVCANHVIMESRKNEELREIINSATLATPDGMSVVWACKFLGCPEIQRVCGSELMLNVCALSAEKGYTNFFYGGADGEPEELANILSTSFPGLQVIGTYSTPFDLMDPMTDEEGIAMINRLSPDIVWVGLGAPKQELWMRKYWKHLDTRVMIGVGAAFDFLSGRQLRAPMWVQQCGLEWLHRLIHNPRRLWRRNLYHFSFVYHLTLQRLGFKTYQGR